MAHKRNKSLANKLCSCIKKVRKTIKLRKGSAKGVRGREQAAIGICVRSVLQTRGKTLKKFSCLKRPTLVTQSIV
jgi:hypothetical protein